MFCSDTPACSKMSRSKTPFLTLVEEKRHTGPSENRWFVASYLVPCDDFRNRPRSRVVPGSVAWRQSDPRPSNFHESCQLQIMRQGTQICSLIFGNGMMRVRKVSTRNIERGCCHHDRHPSKNHHPPLPSCSSAPGAWRLSCSSWTHASAALSTAKIDSSHPASPRRRSRQRQAEIFNLRVDTSLRCC